MSKQPLYPHIPKSKAALYPHGAASSEIAAKSSIEFLAMLEGMRDELEQSGVNFEIVKSQLRQAQDDFYKQVQNMDIRFEETSFFPPGYTQEYQNGLEAILKEVTRKWNIPFGIFRRSVLWEIVPNPSETVETLTPEQVNQLFIETFNSRSTKSRAPRQTMRREGKQQKTFTLDVEEPGKPKRRAVVKFKDEAELREFSNAAMPARTRITIIKEE